MPKVTNPTALIKDLGAQIFCATTSPPGACSARCALSPSPSTESAPSPPTQTRKNTRTRLPWRRRARSRGRPLWQLPEQCKQWRGWQHHLDLLQAVTFPDGFGRALAPHTEYENCSRGQRAAPPGAVCFQVQESTLQQSRIQNAGEICHCPVGEGRRHGGHWPLRAHPLLECPNHLCLWWAVFEQTKDRPGWPENQADWGSREGHSSAPVEQGLALKCYFCA